MLVVVTGEDVDLSGRSDSEWTESLYHSTESLHHKYQPRRGIPAESDRSCRELSAREEGKPLTDGDRENGAV